jgi:diacylglycerol kinase family enzyme
VNADRRKGRVSAKALFYWRTVVEFLRYRFQTVRITVDDAEPLEARIALVAACNGRYFGAGMMIAPDAALDDGQFDVVIVRASGKPGLLKDLRLLYGGRHRNHRAVTILRGRKVTVEPMDAGNVPLVDADGEAPGCAPATFEILPGVLLLKC